MYNVLGTLGTNRVILRHTFGVPRNNCVLNCLYMFIYVAHLIRNTVYSYIFGFITLHTFRTHL